MGVSMPLWARCWPSDHNASSSVWVYANMHVNEVHIPDKSSQTVTGMYWRRRGLRPALWRLVPFIFWCVISRCCHLLRLFRVRDRWMSVGHCWNDTDRGKPKYWEGNLSKWHFIHHKCHIDWPGIEFGPWGESPTVNRLSHGKTLHLF